MSSELRILIPDELSQAIGRAAEAQGKTPEEWVMDAAKRDLDQHFFDATQPEAEISGGKISDEEIEAIVDKAIQESRDENHSR